jgi:hypothetical protein
MVVQQNTRALSWDVSFPLSTFYSNMKGPPYAQMHLCPREVRTCTQKRWVYRSRLHRIRMLDTPTFAFQVATPASSGPTPAFTVGSIQSLSVMFQTKPPPDVSVSVIVPVGVFTVMKSLLCPSMLYRAGRNILNPSMSSRWL